MLPEVIEEFTNDLNHPLRLHLEENDLWDWNPENDMHIYHGMGDELIPYENSEIAYNTFIDNGSENVNLYLVNETLGGHSEVAVYCLLSAYSICESNYKNIRDLGDLNNDSIVNIQDLLIMLSFILNSNNVSGLDLWLSDFDSNELINVQDIVLILEKILRN